MFSVVFGAYICIANDRVLVTFRSKFTYSLMSLVMLWRKFVLCFLFTLKDFYICSIIKDLAIHWMVTLAEPETWQTKREVCHHFHTCGDPVRHRPLQLRLIMWRPTRVCMAGATLNIKQSRSDLTQSACRPVFITPQTFSIYLLYYLSEVLTTMESNCLVNKPLRDIIFKKSGLNYKHYKRDVFVFCNYIYNKR